MKSWVSVLALFPFVALAQPIAERECDSATEKSYWSKGVGGMFKCGTDRAVPNITPATPTRTLGTTFQPSATNPTLVSYSVEISCTISLSGSQSSDVELRSDANATPTTGRGSVGSGQSGALVVGLSITNRDRKQLLYLVPPGHNVRLVHTGNCTVSLVGQSEEALSQ